MLHGDLAVTSPLVDHHQMVQPYQHEGVRENGCYTWEDDAESGSLSFISQ